VRILIAGGGTGGHINPAIAVARYIQKMRPSTEILFAGVSGGMEEKLVTEAGFQLKTFRMRGIKHKLTPAGMAFNVGTLVKMPAAHREADALIDSFKPDLVFGTGGFTCYPPLVRAAKRGIPTVIHESNVQPGRTIKALAKHADKLLLGFADAEEYFAKYKSKLVHTGNPLREGMVYIKKADAKRELGVQLPLVYSFWGSLGAREMNKLTAGLFALNNGRYAHVHSTGAFGWQWMPEFVKEKGVDLAASPHIDMREYVHNAPTVMAAADLVLCRAGAMTMSELCATGTPSVIVPSPNVSGHHQHRNARALSSRGAAVFVEESDCTAVKLDALIEELLADSERLAQMGQAAQSLAIFDGEEKIYRELLKLIPAQAGK